MSSPAAALSKSKVLGPLAEAGFPDEALPLDFFNEKRRRIMTWVPNPMEWEKDTTNMPSKFIIFRPERASKTMVFVKFNHGGWLKACPVPPLKHPLAKIDLKISKK
jgi:hypothetical protein